MPSTPSTSAPSTSAPSASAPSASAPSTPAPQGLCPKCKTPNSFGVYNCATCGARLPWADALDAAQQKGTQQAAAKMAGIQPAGAPAPAGRSAPTGARPAPGRVNEFRLVPVEHDEPSAGLNSACFAFPILGFFAYVWLTPTMPRQAASAGRSAWYGILLWFVFVALQMSVIGWSLFSAGNALQESFRPAPSPTQPYSY